MMRAADALGIARLLAAVLFPGALAAGGWLPLVLFGVAAATDFFDGVVARRGRGPTAHGAVLDNVADIAFVMAANGTAAVLHMVPWAVPLAIASSFGVYVLASATSTATHGTVRMARSSVGHAAGVLNYALAGLVAGAVALPGDAWGLVLAAGSAVVIAVNLTAIMQRLTERRRAPVPPGAGTAPR
jgi:phosphatidylglycerophosphate synthase